MVTSSNSLYPYDSLNKYTESIVQCPMCHYYLKINPQTDSMLYKLISKDIIHFLTIHQFNASIHQVIIEYQSFSFIKVVNFSDNPDTSQKSKDIFPIYHLVNLNKYNTFRDRILELESNNNQLIASFKTKLDSLESSYKQTEIDNAFLLQQVSELNDLRSDFENALSDKLIALDSYKEIISTQSEEKRNLQKQINMLEHEKFSIEQEKEENNQQKNQFEDKIDVLENQIKNLSMQTTITKQVKDSPQVDQKVLDLLGQERHQKREAIREKKIVEAEIIKLKETMTVNDERFLNELSTKEKQLAEILDDKEQVKHKITLEYENKISDLTLLVQDQKEQLSLLQKESTLDNLSISPTKFDKVYRQQTADLFIKVQKLFNQIQYDILLSFYQFEHFSGQLRNAFDQFFNLLVQKANTIGQILLSDPDFSLFKDLRELNPRLKFSEEQQFASIQLQSLNFVMNDTLKYIFSVIKAVKASMEEDNYVIIPDDVQISTLVPAKIKESKICFHIPINDQTHFEKVGSTIRVFRPISELYKDSFILITKQNDSTLNNNTYSLIPFTFEVIDSKGNLEIDNFFSEKDSFQLGSFFDNQFFVIQKIDFQNKINLIKEIIIKNDLSNAF